MYIVIPTNKPRDELAEKVKAIEATVSNARVVVTGFNASAAVNRNYGLSRVPADETLIMLDDDVEGFSDGWAGRLVSTLGRGSNVVMVSARLVDKSGRPGVMVGENYDVDTPVVEVEQRQLPTAAIAFVNDPDVRFDMNYVGSGFEDNDFCHQLALKYKKGRFLIDNGVKLVHRNEMKGQRGPNWQRNQAYYVNKWQRFLRP